MMNPLVLMKWALHFRQTSLEQVLYKEKLTEQSENKETIKYYSVWLFTFCK